MTLDTNIDFINAVMIFVNESIPALCNLPTFHDGDRVLHLGSKDIWSKHSGKILDTHLVLIAVRLDLIQESTASYQS